MFDTANIACVLFVGVIAIAAHVRIDKLNRPKAPLRTCTLHGYVEPCPCCAPVMS
jgi:hypothetical protein